MNKRKIINDPIYGLIFFPFEELYELIDHPYFQRLRRISQMGFSSYVYPGAIHSRFSHALGALHLMTQAIVVLRQKGIEISEEEHLAVCQAILLHDIGHGPFSHGLEKLIFNKHHESISLDIFKFLNTSLNQDLSLAIEIFKGEYKRKFLTQLVSSQIDMDRMDYLTRDSFYTGVVEGVIGYKRLISMMTVVNDDLVLEEKALISIEKFLLARHFMYKQVYLHKTSIVAETMLRQYVIKLISELSDSSSVPTGKLAYFLKAVELGTINEHNYLDLFTELDDIDVFASLKASQTSNNFILKYLSTCLMNRNLFKIHIQEEPFSSDFLANLRHKARNHFNKTNVKVEDLIFSGQETIQAYNQVDQKIQIQTKKGEIKAATELMEPLVKVMNNSKYYICHPNFIE